MFIGKTKVWLRFNQNVLRFCSFLACLCLVALSFAVFVPVYIVTDTANATAGTPTASTLTFTSTNPVASVSLAMGSPTGTFATSSASEKAAFSISTNNYTGYTLTMTSTGSNTTLTDGSSHNISTISSSTTEAIFSSSDAAGQALNNRWGYIPSYYNSAANTTTYYPAPTSVNAATLRATSSANSSNGVDNADDYTIGLGFRADYNSPSGTYANDTFILEFVANTITYTITYDKNTTDTVTNMPANQSGDASATNIALSNLVPVRTGYSFLGWCFGTVTTANGYDTCDGTIYNPDGDGTNLNFGIDQTVANNPTLYAMWDSIYTLTFVTGANVTNIVFDGVAYTNNQTRTVRASEATSPYHIYGNYATKYAFSSWTITAGTLENSNYQNTAYTVTGSATITLASQQVTVAIQNLSAANCTTTARPVYDTRDNTVYWVQKLPDGKCWMLDNMALDLTDSTIVDGLSNTNTNLDSTSLAKFKDGSGTTSDRYPTAAYGTFGSIDSYSQPLTYMNEKNSVAMPSDATSSTSLLKGAYGFGQGKIGAYYNYCAASVGYYCFGNGTSAGNTYSNSIYDVCPAGWRMPTGGSSGEYNALYTNAAINSNNATFRDVLSTPLSGRFNGGMAANRGNNGSFWSSTGRNVMDAYDLHVSAYSVSPNSFEHLNYGLSVRCLMPIYTITFRTNNATGIVFNGVTYTDGQTLTISAGEATGKKFHIYGNYGTRYAFSSWSTTAGTFENQNYQNTAFTVTGDATITLTGQYVNTAMQNLSTSNCTTTARPVYDNRDNSVYWVQQLPDGNCWMLDNLALDLTDSSIVNSLSTSNTNLYADALNYFKNGGGTTSDRFPTATNANWTSSYSYSRPLSSATYKSVTLRPSSAENYTGTNEGAYGLGQGKIGVYYNYCAASVGYYCFGDGSSSGGTPDGDNYYDVCPAGWRMPTGGSAGEYSALYTTSTINSDDALYRNTLSVPLSGNFNNGSGSYGQYGYFLSSTRNQPNYMYILFNRSSGVFPANTNHPRYYGYSVRCILDPGYTITFKTSNASNIVFDGVAYTNNQTTKARAGTYHIYGNYGTRYAFSSWSATAGSFVNQNYQNTGYTVTGNATITLTGQSVSLTMQNVTSSSCTTTARPAYDTRDNRIYWIQQLADGNCWMLDSLALDISNSTVMNGLTTSNTNIDSTSLATLKNSWTGETWTTQKDRNIPFINTSQVNEAFVPMHVRVPSGYSMGAFGLGQNRGGVNYNYCAATAGSYCGTPTGGTGVVLGDLCPANWGMPGYSTFYYLCTAIKGSACSTSVMVGESMSADDPNSVQVKLSLPLSKYYLAGSFYDFILYLTTSVDTTDRYNPASTFHSDAGHVYSYGTVDPFYGNAVRCILK